MNEPARIIQGAVEHRDVDIRHEARAGDADRDRVITHLRDCHEQGRISGAVFSARMETAAEAITLDQLAALITDLPALTVPGPGLAHRVRAAGRTTGGRRCLYLGGAVSALLWAAMVPVLIYTSTGYLAVYNDGADTLMQVEHPVLALAVMWFFIITGIIGFVADLLAWVSWEN